MGFENILDNETEIFENFHSEDKEFGEIPYDSYEVRVESMDWKTSKKGDPMLAIRFIVLEGKYKKWSVFYNQILTTKTAWKVRQILEALKDDKLPKDVKNLSQLQEETELIFERSKGFEYVLDYYEENGYKRYDISGVFEVE